LSPESRPRFRSSRRQSSGSLGRPSSPRSKSRRPRRRQRRTARWTKSPPSSTGRSLSGAGRKVASAQKGNSTGRIGTDTTEAPGAAAWSRSTSGRKRGNSESGEARRPPMPGPDSGQLGGVAHRQRDETALAMKRNAG